MDVEGFKQFLGPLLSVSLGVQGDPQSEAPSAPQESYTVHVGGVAPGHLHDVPVTGHAVPESKLQVQGTPFILGLISYMITLV